MVSDIGNQVADIVRTQSDLDGLKAAIAQTGTSLQGLPEKERLAKLAALRDTAVYKKVTENTGTGSDVQRAITAATAAVSGLAGGNLNAALAGAAAPYIANEIGKNITAENTAAGIMAHAVVNAVLAKVQGQNALDGASGAAVGEAMGYLIAKEAYKKAPSQLNETEKQTVAALSTLASGLAGALAGNSTEAVATAAKAGQTTVENNFLSQGRPKDFTEQLKGCNGNPSCEQGVRKDMAKESAENVLKLKSCWDAGDTACVAQMRTQIELNEKAYTALRVQDDLAGRAYENSAKWYADIIDNCNGQCGWLSASLQKAFADGLTNAVYGALAVSTGSLPKPGQTVKPVSEATGRGIVPEQGSVANANFAQSKIRANETFSAEGVAKYSQMAGQPVNTVDDLANAIRSGLIKPSQLSVDYVEMNGTRLILNTRTSVALDRAGIPKSDWYGTNQTNVKVPGMDGKTYNDLAADQLIINKLPETGSSDIPRGRK
ncbi:VENN motif pre-toxin domain-containing protein [Cronobacter dublinensis]|uniref:VENN motif pre-toxin domain-containing protein n=1 Tax=Cronobacter dublinensis TaxID=413497 RepID=UPI0023DB9C2E|nr:VENN motif pre-toxin domain-containing protein [Cronobacter dublinensis]WEP47978.1 VENN motif pre-toxin domain-containing protein [Cronobacter dublinensis]